MSASRARRIPFVIIFSLTLIVGVVPAAAAADTAPVPTSMAAVGDSITQAASTGGSLGADAPQNSWSTGWSSSVDSHAERLGLSGAAANNLSVSGAKVANLTDQMVEVGKLDPDPGYLTVLIGGNDLCTATVDDMTSTEQFEIAFTNAMSTIKAQSPGAYVYVVSIPDVYQLWELFKSNFWARFIWSSAKICQSLLANPTSTKKVDDDRRRAVQARNVAYNTIMANVCDSDAFRDRCHHDHGAVFGTQLVASDVSGDYFHPSASGQARLADVTWGAGYTFGEPSTPPNQAPTASFTSACSGLTCSFNASASSDDVGITGYAWNFGDGTTGSGVTTSNTYAAGGPYTVTLTVTDGGGLTGTKAETVEPQAAQNQAPTASFTSACSGLTCSFDASDSSDDVGITDYAWNFGDGSTGSGETTSRTYAAGGGYTVTLTVTDDDGATGSTNQSVTVSAGTTTITLSVDAYKVKGLQKADLTWTGATSTNVDIYRNGFVIDTTGNDGFHTDNIDARGGGSYTYKVCEATTTNCSDAVSASY